MRGRAAISADIIESLDRCNTKTEILGFVNKNIGKVEIVVWVECGKPNNPGRLNDLSHILKPADLARKSQKILD